MQYPDPIILDLPDDVDDVDVHTVDCICDECIMGYIAAILERRED